MCSPGMPPTARSSASVRMSGPGIARLLSRWQAVGGIRWKSSMRALHLGRGDGQGGAQAERDKEGSRRRLVAGRQAPGLRRQPTALRVWEMETAKEIAHRKDFAKATRRLQWSPDGRSLAVHFPSNAGPCLVVEASARPRCAGLRILVTAWPSLVAGRQDDRTIILSGEPLGVRLYDVATGKRLRDSQRSGTSIRGFAWSPDGPNLAR